MEPIKPRASTRISIQWSAGLPQEETDTLVLTLPRHYLDLRVYRAGHPREGTIEWAQAGYVEQIPSETAESPSLEFRPIISSVPPPPPEIEKLLDQGSFRTLPNGDIEERGKMYNPSAGENQDYIEVWRRLPLHPSRDADARDPPSLLLECPPCAASPDIHAFVGRIGPYALGIARIASPGDTSGPRFVAWRETFDPAQLAWRRVHTVGAEEEVAKHIPSVSAFVNGRFMEGGKQVVGEREWVVLYSSGTD